MKKIPLPFYAIDDVKATDCPKNPNISQTLDTSRYFNTVELHLSELIGAASHPDMQKIQKIGLFCENRLHWRFEVRMLLFTVCTCS
jgi:hypothetical protein